MVARTKMRCRRRSLPTIVPNLCYYNGPLETCLNFATQYRKRYYNIANSPTCFSGVPVGVSIDTSLCGGRVSILSSAGISCLILKAALSFHVRRSRFCGEAVAPLPRLVLTYLCPKLHGEACILGPQSRLQDPMDIRRRQYISQIMFL